MRNHLSSLIGLFLALFQFLIDSNECTRHYSFLSLSLSLTYNFMGISPGHGSRVSLSGQQREARCTRCYSPGGVREEVREKEGSRI